MLKLNRIPPHNASKKGKIICKMTGKTMKKMEYVSNKQKKEEILIPQGKFASDWFRCRSCGREVMMKTLTDTIKCSECGGTMDRI